jgi:tRNA 5-methylaminomethyl-2-thiouridine biosynthesis bifunctional protein
MPQRISPAVLVLDTDGTPYSPLYRDVYHSWAGGQAQARDLFLGGNHLPGAWGGRPGFTILETGFGLGTNFLATWAAWRRPAAPGQA